MNLNYSGVGNRSGIFEHLLLVSLLAVLAALTVSYNLLWRWDNLLYDAQLSLWSRKAPENIVIIAIDDESLNRIGRWPWPRSIHARLIDKLEKESPAVIGMDIIFSEPDNQDPQSDQLLANSIRNSGKVVLPVYMSQQSLNSIPIEALPLTDFASSAAALGHVHLKTDDDGIARTVFLKEGIGRPHWYHYALAVLNTIAKVSLETGLDNGNSEENYSAMVWAREYPLLIPYAGPPGHFQQIGYSQVLSGNYQKNFFKDKIVLVGATAEGLGDALPTPLSGRGGSMSGVEIVANIVDALQNGLRITELDKNWLIALSALLVAFPLLVYPFLNPGQTLLVLFGIVMATISIVALMLWLGAVWFPVSTVLLLQLISYPLWSWRRLKLAMRYINFELDQLSARQKALGVHARRNIEDEINFISLFIQVIGWQIQNAQGKTLISQGAAPRYNFSSLKNEGWSIDGSRYWAKANYQGESCQLGLNLGIDAVIGDQEMRLLKSLINSPLSTDSVQNAFVEDVLQAKIKQVQSAGNEYEQLRHIIDDSLSVMADGVLVCSSHGQIMLSNQRAGWYLYGDDNARLNGQSITRILQLILLKEDSNWNSLLQSVLFERQRVLSNARHQSGRDLMIELSPLKIAGETFDGFVVNLSDISLLKSSERKRNEVLDFLSHDLRAPLSSMLAMIEVAKNKKTLNETQAMLTVMEKNTYKTLHLAEQFLQLSRANTSENLKFYDIDFNSMVLNAIDQLWALSNKMNVTIRHEFDQDENWTHAEGDLLERAVMNLLSNAIKYSQSGTTVTVTVQMLQHEISCCVHDQGPGITAHELPHLFEMFRRVQGAGVERKQGIGLGLAFVDAVAKRHSGHVDVESTPGEGSTFCIRIPQVDLQKDPLQHTR